jgi:hypothetical protein
VQQWENSVKARQRGAALGERQFVAAEVADLEDFLACREARRRREITDGNKALLAAVKRFDARHGAEIARHQAEASEALDDVRREIAGVQQEIRDAEEELELSLAGELTEAIPLSGSVSALPGKIGAPALVVPRIASAGGGRRVRRV